MMERMRLLCMVVGNRRSHMKLNNKGFTVVELLATFTLTMVVMVFLFEVVLELKNVYIASNVETLAKNENALIASELNKQIYNKNIPISCLNNTCTLSDGKTIIFDSSSAKIGVKTYEMPEDTTIEHLSIGTQCTTSAPKNSENCFLKVSYEVKSPDLKNNIPFNLVLIYKG